MNTKYKISQISKLYGIGLDSLRYYEKLGILSPTREQNNYRTYGLDDIWKLNMIKDLRKLDFSMEEIKTYLENRTITSTQNLLSKEIDLIENKVQSLLKTKQTLITRQNRLNSALKTHVLDQVIENYLPKRKSIILEKNDTQEEEMDLMAKQLHHVKEKQNKKQKQNLENKLYILGDSVLGATINPKDYQNSISQKYSGVFMLISQKDPYYHSIIPQGLYLTYTYKGGYQGTWKALEKLKQHAQKKGYNLEGNALELWEIDIHETQDIDEFLTQVQIKVKPKT